MRFWDANAVVPLLVNESQSPTVGRFLRDDPGVVVWWITRSECVSALARKRREGTISPLGQARSRVVLHRLSQVWTEVLPRDVLRAQAEILLDRHPLRTADAYQLAAALDWRDGTPEGAGFVCFDERLREAVKAEGFEILPADPGSLV